MVEDHALVREALKNMLEVDGSIHIARQVSSWQDAVRYLKQEAFDIVLMDLVLQHGSGIMGIEEVRKGWPSLPLLAISGNVDEDTVIGAFRAGASGYIVKSASRSEFLAAFKTVQEGGAYLDPQLTAVVLGYLRSRPPGANTAPVALTAREKEIMVLIAQGMGNREIAKTLEVAETTVKSYLRALYRRLGVADRAQATAYVLRAGLIQSPHESM